MIELAVGVIGIYVCFLSWGVLQERVTTRPYITQSGDDSILKEEKFKFFIFLNLSQSIMATLIGLGYSRLLNRSTFKMPSLKLMSYYFVISLLSSLASPFGYESLKHVDYPTMVLAKSCKLIPVMIMSFLVYRKTFKAVEYLSVLLISAGVFLFTFYHDSKGKKGGSSGDSVKKENSFYGLFLLFVNLCIDGLTNSTQDFMKKRWEIKGTEMMFFMNLCSSVLMGVYLTLVLPSLSVLSDLLPVTVSSKEASYELWNALDFLKVHPDALVDVLMFSIAGALGQCFIFYVLAKFESRVLVTINVTRKMMTIILSVIWFGHSLNMLQYFSVSLVFIAIFIEGFYGGKSKGKTKKEKVEEDEVVDMGEGVKLNNSSATESSVRTRRKAKKDQL